MPKKKKSKPRPTKSFEQLVADATLSKFSGYINFNVSQTGQAIAQKIGSTLADLKTRILVIEDILLEAIPTLTKDDIRRRVSEVEDKAAGLVAAEDGVVAKGDRVRVEIKTKTSDQAEFQGASRMQIENAGSGNTLGSELEDAMIGMTVGETKEIKFGEEGAMTASISMERISRKPTEPKSEEQPAQEAPGASADAG